jgi:quercetin dioxygenase-like cupin family protein
MILSGLAALLFSTGVEASVQAAPDAPPAPQSSMRKNLQNHELKNSDREVFQSEVSLEPGGFFPRHSHPGEEFIYVLKGSWVYELDGQPPVTVKAGEALFIPYGAVHSARNISDETGIELATHVIEKDKPLLTLAK